MSSLTRFQYIDADDAAIVKMADLFKKGRKAMFYVTIVGNVIVDIKVHDAGPKEALKSHV